MRLTYTAIPPLLAAIHSPISPTVVVSGFLTTPNKQQLASSWTKPSHADNDGNANDNQNQRNKSRLFSLSERPSLEHDEFDNAADENVGGDVLDTFHDGQRSRESPLFHVSKTLGSGTSMGIATLILTSSTIASAATSTIDITNAANLPTETIVELTSSAAPSTSLVVENSDGVSGNGKLETKPASVISTPKDVKDVTAIAETKDAVPSAAVVEVEVVAAKTESPAATTMDDTATKADTATTVDTTIIQQPSSSSSPSPPSTNIDAAKLKAATAKKKAAALRESLSNSNNEDSKAIITKDGKPKFSIGSESLEDVGLLAVPAAVIASVVAAATSFMGKSKDENDEVVGDADGNSDGKAEGATEWKIDTPTPYGLSKDATVYSKDTKYPVEPVVPGDNTSVAVEKKPIDPNTRTKSSSSSISVEDALKTATAAIAPPSKTSTLTSASKGNTKESKSISMTNIMKGKSSIGNIQKSEAASKMKKKEKKEWKMDTPVPYGLQKDTPKWSDLEKKSFGAEKKAVLLKGVSSDGIDSAKASGSSLDTKESPMLKKEKKKPLGQKSISMVSIMKGKNTFLVNANGPNAPGKGPKKSPKVVSSSAKSQVKGSADTDGPKSTGSLEQKADTPKSSSNTMPTKSSPPKSLAKKSISMASIMKEGKDSGSDDSNGPTKTSSSSTATPPPKASVAKSTLKGSTKGVVESTTAAQPTQSTAEPAPTTTKKAIIMPPKEKSISQFFDSLPKKSVSPPKFAFEKTSSLKGSSAKEVKGIMKEAEQVFGVGAVATPKPNKEPKEQQDSSAAKATSKRFTKSSFKSKFSPVKSAKKTAGSAGMGSTGVGGGMMKGASDSSGMMKGPTSSSSSSGGSKAFTKSSLKGSSIGKGAGPGGYTPPAMDSPRDAVVASPAKKEAGSGFLSGLTSAAPPPKTASANLPPKGPTETMSGGSSLTKKSMSMLKQEKKTSLAKKSISMVSIMKGEPESSTAGPAGASSKTSAAAFGGGMMKGKASMPVPKMKGFGKSKFGGGGMLKGSDAASATVVKSSSPSLEEVGGGMSKASAGVQKKDTLKRWSSPQKKWGSTTLVKKGSPDASSGGSLAKKSISMANIVKGTSPDASSSDSPAKSSMLKQEKKTSLAKKSISMVNIMKGSGTGTGPAGSPEQKSAPDSGSGSALGGGGMLKGKSAAANVQSLSAPGFGSGGGGGMMKGKQETAASKKGFGKSSAFGGGGMLKGKAAGSSSPGFGGGVMKGNSDAGSPSSSAATAQQASSPSNDVQQQQLNANRVIPPSAGQFASTSFGNIQDNSSGESSRPNPQNNARIIGGPSTTSGATSGGVGGGGQEPPLSVTVIDPRTGKKRTISVSSNANNLRDS